MLSNTSVIYEPKGKAGEYSKLAVNVYNGCGHRCEYCFAPAFMRTARETFNQPTPRKDILQKIKQNATLLQKEHENRPVLLCFTCDPYQPVDEQFQLSRQSIQILHSCHLNVMILTNLDNKLSLQWEPGAAMPEERINSLRRAHEKGIKTWVSLEPVLYPEITLKIIRRTYGFVDEFKVGTLNYHPHAENVDRHRFAVDVKQL